MPKKRNWIKCAVKSSKRGKLRRWLYHKGLIPTPEAKLSISLLEKVIKDKNNPVYYRRNANLVLNLIRIGRKHK